MMMPEITDDEDESENTDESSEIVDNFESADISREHIQGAFEYMVTLSESDVDELPGRMTARDLAENIASSRANAELDATYSISSNDTRAYELHGVDKMSDADYEFEVTVKFSQND